MGKNLSRHKNCLRNISLSLTLYSFFQSFPSPLSRTTQKWEKSLPAWSQLSDYHSDNHHDCRRKVWTCRGQAWPLITKRSWERKSFNFCPGFFTRSLRKGWRTHTFLIWAPHLFKPTPHRKENYFITCFMSMNFVARSPWPKLQRSEFLITEIIGIFVGLQSDFRQVQAQYARYMSLFHKTEKRRFTLIDPKWVDGKVSGTLLVFLCFSFSLKTKTTNGYSETEFVIKF